MYSELSKGSKRSEESNENVFIELYPGLQRYCRFLSKNKWDGEDIAQETILKAIQHYQSNNNMNAALLNKIAYHHWIDTVRKRKHETIEESPALSTFEDKSLIETVEKLTQQFTPKQAVIFTLKEAFHYKTSEIAELLGISETAVKSNLYRAKKRLIQDDSFDVGPFWSKEEHVLLTELFYESLRTQDPSRLLKMLPVINSLARKDQAPQLDKRTTKRPFTPSTTFSMAA
ncbi:sigma-70 family RNA polymerase sigma factor [Bacillus sp. FJAT-49705]|uniref:Sigma-70 family RNA polymerase sigma factor n=1 Tax=Cytobacillus citreus TaxID=2833586 RepID=A0ABS5NUX9_9BACI|nr:sigma-70 family RNA polymerase sigma factor [Cytobacillus citreus]MBS4190714.1 sigma-70 family RNA polymerase sigma factor [Cytobacillus citreus]